jgi:hypothetical protein
MGADQKNQTTSGSAHKGLQIFTETGGSAWAICSNQRWRRHEQVVAQSGAKAIAVKHLLQGKTPEFGRFEPLRR